MDTLHACIIKQYIYNIIQYNTYKTSYNAIHIQWHTNNTTTIKNTKLWFNKACYRKNMITAISSKHAHAHAHTRSDRVSQSADTHHTHTHMHTHY